MSFGDLGILGWISGKVFYCKRCNQRYDTAIFLNTDTKPRCRFCNEETKIEDASPLRFAVSPDMDVQIYNERVLAKG